MMINLNADVVHLPTHGLEDGQPVRFSIVMVPGLLRSEAPVNMSRGGTSLELKEWLVLYLTHL